MGRWKKNLEWFTGFWFNWTNGIMNQEEKGEYWILEEILNPVLKSWFWNALWDVLWDVHNTTEYMHLEPKRGSALEMIVVEAIEMGIIMDV